MPRLSVFACFLCPRTDEILLVHQQAGKWSLPGGRCYKSENPMSALRREVREETAHEIPPNARPAQTWPIARPWRRRGGHALIHLFRRRPEVIAATEIDAVRWFPLDALPDEITRTALAAVGECLRLTRSVPAERVA